jgi:hypothetical protein
LSPRQIDETAKIFHKVAQDPATKNVSKDVFGGSCRGLDQQGLTERPVSLTIIQSVLPGGDRSNVGLRMTLIGGHQAPAMAPAGPPVHSRGGDLSNPPGA